MGLGMANDAFKFTRSLEFEGHGEADTWLESLASSGVERLWLVVDPSLLPPVTAEQHTWRDQFAFVNAMNARVGLLAGDSLWRGCATAAATPGPDNRGWDVVYKAVDAPMRPTAPPLGDAIDRLEAALNRASSFACMHPELHRWEELFAKAKALGSAEDPNPPYYRDLFPKAGYTAGSRRLAVMAQAGWVFGGMGSWNDMGFEAPETEQDFQNVTSELFSAILLALIAAVNSKLTRVGHRPSGLQTA